MMAPPRVVKILRPVELVEVRARKWARSLGWSPEQADAFAFAYAEDYESCIFSPREWCIRYYAPLR